MQTYWQGWNDYIDGRKFSWINTTPQWREGWIDCRNATKESGKTQQRK